MLIIQDLSRDGDRNANAIVQKLSDPSLVRSARLALARLGAPRRGCGNRIVGPRDVRVTAAHVGAHRRHSCRARTRQVAGHLHRPMRRRKKFDHSGTRPPAIAGWRSSPNSSCTRMAVRAALRLRSRSSTLPGRRFEMVGASASSRRASATAATLAERCFELLGAEARRARSCRARRQPIRQRFASAASDRSGHSSPSLARRNITRSRHCRQRLGPGQPVDPSAAIPAASVARCVSSGVDRERLLGERDRAEAPRRRPRSRARRIEDELVAGLDPSAKRASISPSAIGAARRIGPARRCRSFRPPPGTVARQRRSRHRPARRGRWPAGRRRPAAAVLRDALGIGEREQCADVNPRPRPALAVQALGDVRPAAAMARASRGARRAVAARPVEPVARGRCRRRRGRARRSAPRFRRRARPVPSAAASTTMRASRGGSGSRRSPASSVMRPSPSMAPSAARSACARRARARRRVEKGKLVRARAPGGEIEREATERSAARISGRANGSATPFVVRPRAGSRCRARCGRRGRGADRPPRETPAPFRGG